MSAAKAKSLSVFLPVVIVRVLSALLATAWLAAPAHARGSENGEYKPGNENCEGEHEKVTLCYILHSSADSDRTILVHAKADPKYDGYFEPCNQNVTTSATARTHVTILFFLLKNGK